MNNHSIINIAYVISPHGFGHAARACAVMEFLRILIPQVHFEILTSVPNWFFQQSLGSNFSYHYYHTDVGIIQTDPFIEDIETTANKLQSFVPFSDHQVKPMIELFTKKACRLIVCDIAPMGIAAGNMAGIPTVLIESFTWDWIYQGYLHTSPKLQTYIEYFKDIYEQATFHIQTSPVCLKKGVDLLTNPVARTPRHSPIEIKDKLAIKNNEKMVLLTLGGIEKKFEAYSKLKQSDARFIIPGGAQEYHIEDNATLLPHHSDFYHPDLVNASDVIIGKLGYSTVAEAFFAGIPYIFVPRKGFPETEPLGSFVRSLLSGEEVPLTDFEQGDWLPLLSNKLRQLKIVPQVENGASQIASYLKSLLF